MPANGRWDLIRRLKVNMRLGGPQSQSGQFGKKNLFWWELKHDSFVIQLTPQSLSQHTDVVQV